MLGHAIRRTLPVLSVVLLAAFVAGCSGSGMEGFQFGKGKTEPPPDPGKFPADYKPELADFMRRNLSNPRKVRDAYIARPVLKPVGDKQFYVTCVRYNPQNSENKYEGPTQNVAIFLSGQLNQFLPDDPQMCAGLTYERYPEIENMVP